MAISNANPFQLKDRIVARHRSGEDYKKFSAALKVTKSTVAWDTEVATEILFGDGTTLRKDSQHCSPKPILTSGQPLLGSGSASACDELNQKVRDIKAWKRLQNRALHLRQLHTICRIQIKLSASVPACPEGVTTHTALS
ncbi:unnamed protein product [Pleuronectes platessa]|uniref:Uncharacterized protein n=1 Tax=Pleuronectes platessa TaxID=8262 RepID=A0A9N7VII4_PLEPL|nr:unnamed protein product [Pleuronectes platessa]